MPIFQYRCETCSAAFEHLVSSQAEAKNVTCLSCGGKKITRLFSSSFGIKSKNRGGCGGGCGKDCGLDAEVKKGGCPYNFCNSF